MNHCLSADHIKTSEGKGRASPLVSHFFAVNDTGLPLWLPFRCVCLSVCARLMVPVIAQGISFEGGCSRGTRQAVDAESVLELLEIWPFNVITEIYSMPVSTVGFEIFACYSMHVILLFHCILFIYECKCLSIMHLQVL